MVFLWPNRRSRTAYISNTDTLHTLIQAIAVIVMFGNDEEADGVYLRVQNGRCPDGVVAALEQIGYADARERRVANSTGSRHVNEQVQVSTRKQQ